jgi:hypothetical protein
VSEEASADARNDQDLADHERTGGVDWADPTVPVGDAPALPRWPLIVLGVAWTGWIIFLMVVAVAGRATTV